MNTEPLEPTVGDFYGPVLMDFPEDVQGLILDLFEGKFDTKTDLIAAINVAAAGRAESEEGDS